MAVTETDIRKALAPSKMLMLTPSGCVRRRFPLVTKTTEDVDRCTVYVEEIPPRATRETLSKIFSAFGPVALVSYPVAKRATDCGQNNFGFVEFEDQKSCVAAVESFRAYGSLLTNSDELMKKALSEPAAPSTSRKDNVENASGGLGNGDVHSEDSTVAASSLTGSESSSLPLTQSLPAPRQRRNRKKKKNRHLFNTGLLQRNAKFMGVKIMPKLAWNVIKTRYVALQAKRRKQLKLQLASSKKPVQNRRFFKTIAPGSVVVLHLPRPAIEQELKSLRANLRQYENVEYVDVEVGRVFGYVRMRSATDASWLMSNNTILPTYGLSLLPPSGESEYRKRIDEKRSAKFSSVNPTRKLSGTKKVLAKAEKQLGLKIKIKEIQTEPLSINDAD